MVESELVNHMLHLYSDLHTNSMAAALDSDTVIALGRLIASIPVSTV
jgi:hypothetical protein